MVRTSRKRIGWVVLLAILVMGAGRILRMDDQGEIRFVEDVTNGNQYVGLRAPSAVGSSYTMTLPSALPSSPQFLQIATDGTLSLTSAASSLDVAYDGGRIITADAGAVDIQGTGGLSVTGDISPLGNLVNPKFTSYTKAGLPAASTIGRLARVTDDARGLWMDQGSQWFSLGQRIINVQEFGAIPDDGLDDKAAISAAGTALTSVGGVLYFPKGVYTLVSTPSVTAVTFANPTRIIGESRSSVTINVTTQGHHAFLFQAPFSVSGLTMTRADFASDTQWGALRLDYLVSTPVAQTKVAIDTLDITGFDIGLYVDGGTSADVQSVSARQCRIRSNLLCTGGIASVVPTINCNRCKQVSIEDCELEAFSNLEVNNVYTIGSSVVTVANSRLIKGIGVKAQSGDAVITGHRLSCLSIRGNVFENCSYAVLVSSADQPVDVISIEGNHMSLCTGNTSESAIVGLVNQTGTAPTPYDIGVFSFRGNTIRESDKGCIALAFGAGRIIEHVVLSGNTYYNWSKSSIGTFNVLRLSSTGTFRALHCNNEYANGNSNGRAYLGSGIVAQVAHASLSGIHELSVVLPNQTPDEAVFLAAKGTFSRVLTVSAGGLTVTAGGITITAGDLTALTSDINVQGGYRQVIDTFYQNDVAISQSLVKASRLTAATNNPESIIPLRSGSITGIAIHSNANVTAGSITAEVFFGGVTTGLTAVLDITNPSFKATLQAKDLDTFAANNLIDVRISSTATLLPAATLDIRCVVDLEI